MDLSISLVGLASVVLLSACGPQGGTDVGNGATEFDVEGYEQSETPQSTQQSLSLGSGVELAHVYMALERVRLQPGSDCENENDDEQVDDLAQCAHGNFKNGVVEVMAWAVAHLVSFAKQSLLTISSKTVAVSNDDEVQAVALKGLKALGVDAVSK